MNKTIWKPTPEELRPLLLEATDNGNVPVEEWQEKFVTTFCNILQREPRQYRALGPYWWLFKSIALRMGQDWLGDFVDAEWVEALDYGGDITHDLLAIYTHYSQAMDLGLLYSSVHTLYTVDGEGVTYVISDDDMEARIIG